MPTKETLLQQKADLEQQIQTFVNDLAKLSNEAKENKKQEILALEKKREEIIKQLIKQLKNELTTVSGNTEAEKNIKTLIEKYEREEWENQSYYVGVITLLEGDASAAAQELLTTIQVKTIETLDIKTSLITYELLRGTKTEEGLLKVMDNSLFDTYQEPLKNPSAADTEQEKKEKLDKRLENILKKINGTIREYLLTQFNIDPTKEAIPPVITEVMVPAIEWYLMDFLTGSHTDNITNLTAANQLSIKGDNPLEQFTSLLTSVGDITGKVTAASNKATSLINAIEFLEVHKNLFTKAQQSEILRNPLHFKERFLQNPLWLSDKNVYAISLQEAGIEFGPQEQPFGMSPEETQVIKNEIGTIEVHPSPETTHLILNLTDTTKELLTARNTLRNGAMDRVDSTLSSLEGLIGKPTIKEWFTELKGRKVLNFILKVLGFTGGVEGLQRERYNRKINRELETDEKKSQQISAIFNEYLQTIPEEIEEKNTLPKILEKDKTIKFTEENKPLFNIDKTVLTAAIKEKITDVHSMNPLAIKAAVGGYYNYYTEIITDKQKQPDGTEKEIRREAVNKKNFEKDKEKVIQQYINFMTKHLIDHPTFLSGVDNPNTVAFTMISSLFVTPENVIDGVEAKAFLPESFVAVDNAPKVQTSPTPPPTPASPETTPQASSSLEEEKIANYALDIITLGESGRDYGAVNKNDGNGVSLGILQRHKERAGDLLKLLQEANPTLYATIMTDTLFQNSDTAGNVAWNDTQANQFKKLMENEEMKKAMKQQAIKDVSGYITQIKALEVTEPKALILLARLRNAGSERCKKQIIEPLSSEDRNNPDKIIAQFKTTEYAKKRGNTIVDNARNKIAELNLAELTLA